MSDGDDYDYDYVCLPIRLFQRWHNQKLRRVASVKVLTSKVGLANLFRIFLENFLSVESNIVGSANLYQDSFENFIPIF